MDVLFIVIILAICFMALVYSVLVMSDGYTTLAEKGISLIHTLLFTLIAVIILGVMAIIVQDIKSKRTQPIVVEISRYW